MPVHHRRGKRERVHERLRMVTCRTSAYVWKDGRDAPVPGFSFVADFSEEGVGLYVGEKIRERTKVRVSFDDESAPSFQGVVMWCQRYAHEQHFVGHTMFNYRLGIEFRFSSEPERQRYLELLKELELRVRAIQPGMIF
ncbi:MAG: PilZ domain-containing protein [Bdellovibrionales bacterium]|nr:PilZ domain-containing protein [Bdellovibrionales bacterium]